MKARLSIFAKIQGILKHSDMKRLDELLMLWVLFLDQCLRNSRGHHSIGVGMGVSTMGLSGVRIHGVVYDNVQFWERYLVSLKTPLLPDCIYMSGGPLGMIKEH